MVRLIFSGNDAVLLPPAELVLIWPYAMDAGKVALDKADGSTWWERRG
jgi:transcription-repair coupling factor (superfamily II helicase)